MVGLFNRLKKIPEFFGKIGKFAGDLASIIGPALNALTGSNIGTNISDGINMFNTSFDTVSNMTKKIKQGNYNFMDGVTDVLGTANKLYSTMRSKEAF
jgi:hypothetical protein